MACFDYKCQKCGKVFEYNTSVSMPADFHPPKDNKCVDCGGELEKLFTTQGQSFDILGSCYMNDWGKHAWKRKMSTVDQANVLMGEKNPY